MQEEVRIVPPVGVVVIQNPDTAQEREREKREAGALAAPKHM